MKHITKIIIAGIIAILGAIAGLNIIFSNQNGETKLEIAPVTIEYAAEEVPTEIENEDGTTEIIETPTVQFVESDQVVEECPEDSLECAKGAGSLPDVDISSPQAFRDSVINKCIDFDGAYGSQCFDLMALFHYLYTGRWLSANGTGAAYGIWDARGINNQGGEYELITDTHRLRLGDFVIFHNGIYGHVGMALGSYNNGYIALLGTNQGGPACPGGGAAANIINMSLTSFSGAFRPKIWIQPEPTPEPTPATKNYVYQKGDYFSKFLIEQGYSDGSNLWGEEGDVRFYNEQLRKQGILNYYDGKYWNNIPVGTEVVLEAR